MISTSVMTLTEIPSWKRWGLRGVFEWHENQVLSNRLLRLISSHYSREKDTTVHFKGIFLLHFLNGIIAGIVYPFLIYAELVTFRVSDLVPPYLLGLLYGLVLWLLTLVPIHKPITGFSPWNHPLGRFPAVASLVGHIIYGIVLGVFVGIVLE
jgi:hypothetical protein